MPTTAFDQYRRFATDAYGLERLLRLAQASTQITISFFLTPSFWRAIPRDMQKPDLRRGLSALKVQLGLVRRFFRLFRFLDAFTNSCKLFVRLAPSDKASRDAESMHLERSLDAAAAAFNGGYLFLETVTIVDALGIPELVIWGPDAERLLKLESQRCWFFALAAGALGGTLRLWKISQKRRAHKNQQLTEGVNNETTKKVNPDRGGEVIAALDATHGRILRKTAACCLDLALPGSVIGWMPARPGMIGILMSITSVLTGLDVWERCGKEVHA